MNTEKITISQKIKNFFSFATLAKILKFLAFFFTTMLVGTVAGAASAFASASLGPVFGLLILLAYYWLLGFGGLGAKMLAVINYLYYQVDRLTVWYYTRNVDAVPAQAVTA